MNYIQIRHIIYMFGQFALDPLCLDTEIMEEKENNFTNLYLQIRPQKM